MAQLTVKINGYAYTLACEDGQEAHLQQMAREVERRIEGLKAVGGTSGEGRMLVLVSLLMADELHDTAIEMSNLRAQLGGHAPAAQASPDQPRDSARLSRLAQKAEDIARGFEQP